MMKLRYAPASPFVRKVTVLALETGLDEEIERVPANPWDPESDLPDANPLGKVPALELEDGSVLADSTLICEYLDSLQDGPKLFPASGAERWRVLRHHALANGILEAAVSAVVETLRRPEALRWPDWIDRQNDKVRRALDVLEADRAALGGNSGEAPDIAAITAAIALDYLDFRFPGLDWREGRDGLAAWHKEISGRASLQATMPVG